jgi:hypothetical protein
MTCRLVQHDSFAAPQSETPGPVPAQLWEVLALPDAAPLEVPVMLVAPVALPDAELPDVPLDPLDAGLELLLQAARRLVARAAATGPRTR